MSDSVSSAGEEVDAAVRGGARESARPLGLSVADRREAAVWVVGPQRRLYTLGKRVFDCALAALLLVATAPLLLVVAALVRLTSPGPVLFRQRRCGQWGREFICYKFRTMVDGAELTRHEFEALNEMDGPVFKIRNDPRVTRVGRFLRRTSIDELPQLWNVLRGDMSIVGPRPPLPEEVARYRPRDFQRLAVVPGLTCLWQIKGRSEIKFDEWVRLDLEYIRRRGFWFDLAIVLRTIPAVLSGRGAA
jgi:exopolysaccharide biosynthesis polyprenyl glycosylphosphotransferase